ncbi:hypothetical protein RclHR1_00710011 [Rhizophagus clarus]|uniref:Uncharacterized protein n=1 Tax=Rhizophagus clarus TaxID=94130 RepID=A0A2Z6SAX1_9GLOM|nr:hypothetical protein RclHR1_00710011 [Rhizophagus clarus]
MIDKPHGNCTLIEDLYAKNIRDEEDIPDTIKVFDVTIKNLDDDMIDSIQVQVKDKDGILTDLTPIQQSVIFLDVNEPLANDNRKNQSILNPTSEKNSRIGCHY